MLDILTVQPARRPNVKGLYDTFVAWSISGILPARNIPSTVQLSDPSTNPVILSDRPPSNPGPSMFSNPSMFQHGALSEASNTPVPSRARSAPLSSAHTFSPMLLLQYGRACPKMEGRIQGSLRLLRFKGFSIGHT